MEVVSVNGQSRTVFGKSANKALRKEGMIPGVLYSKGNVVHFSTTHKDLKPIVYTPEFKKAAISVDGTTYNCLLQDIIFHPVTDEIVHIDFVQMVDNMPLRTEVPVKFEGVSPGVKEGGKLIQTMRKVKIKCLPKNLVGELVVDISELELGKSIRVGKIDIPDGVEIMSNPSTPVANVEVPRALKSEEAAEAAAGVEAAEAAEGGEEAAAE